MRNKIVIGLRLIGLTIVTSLFALSISTKVFSYSEYVERIGGNSYLNCLSFVIDEGQPGGKDQYYGPIYFEPLANYRICSWQESISNGLNTCSHCDLEEFYSWNPSLRTDYNYYACANTACSCTKSCPCTPRSCPTPIPADKFRTNPQYVNGASVDCGANGCAPISATCAPSYYNAAPTCSSLPASIEMNRTDTPESFALTVTDTDYGDTVQITKVSVVDTAGRLNSCVSVKTEGGTGVNNLVVKSGSDTAGQISGSVRLVADARTSHGVYVDAGNGTSRCSGYIEVQITDIDSDPNGGLDSSASATCRVNLSVTNNNPVVSNVTVLDRDPIVTLRDTSLNLLASATNAAPFYIGSSSEIRRAGYCKQELSIENLGQCAAGQFEPQRTKRNPFLLSMQVSDADGVKDIKDLGFWLQRSDTTGGAGTYPLTSVTGRESIQALVGSRANYTIDGVNYFINDNLCIGSTCTTNVSETGSLLGLSLITSRGTLVTQNGTISSSAYQRVPFTTWLYSGWPDCNDNVSGCVSSNVHASARVSATSDATNGANYDWFLSGDKSHMMCLSGTDSAASVLPRSATCPASCAACISLENITKLAGETSVSASFLVAMNDKEAANSPHGMNAGKYTLLVGAEDKVGGFANGADKYKVATNASNQQAQIIFDPNPPAVSITLTNPVNTDEMQAIVALSEDAAKGSKIAGRSTRFMIKEEYANPTDITGVISYLKRTATGTDLWDGKADFTVFTNTANQAANFTGFGLTTEAGIAAGICAFDGAGNMCCAKTVAMGVVSSCPTSGTSGLYGYGAAWLQTSLGSVYSNSSPSGAAFAMTVPASSNATSAGIIPKAYAVQSGSAASNLVITAGIDIGITGGYEFGGSFYPLGFSSSPTRLENYRKANALSAFNVTNVNSTDRETWYALLSAQTVKFCENGGKCVESAILSDTSIDAAYKVIRISSSYIGAENISCKGANVIFITNKAVVTLSGQVTKASSEGNCLFIVDNGAKLILADTASAKKTGDPAVDLFEAGVVVSNGGKFETKGVTTLKNIVLDRLEWRGFLFDDSGEAPTFGRRLNLSNNKKFPAEWLIYDATVLDAYRAVLGYEKTVDVKCGTSNHILCRGN